jgi:hypothetical protein
MDLVIDIQSFKDNKNCVISKEVAVFALHQDFSGHWIVSPKCNSKFLRKDILRQNNWLTINHHGLEWYEGDAAAKKMWKTLQGICMKANKIYVRGEEKRKLLEKVTTRQIINLEKDNTCPPFEKLPWCEKYCIQHAIKPCYLRYSCAVNNAFRLKSWLTTRKEGAVDTGEFTFEPPINLCDEHERNSSVPSTYQISHGRSVSGRSNSSRLGKARCFCV